MVDTIKNGWVTFISIIKIAPLLFIIFSAKGFCTGYVTSVDTIKKLYEVDNYAMYQYNSTIQTVALPDQPLALGMLVGAVDLSAYSAVLALYNRSTGKYYDQEILRGGIFQLGSSDGIVSINTAIELYQSANPTSNIIIATDVVYTDFSNSCLQMAIVKNSDLENGQSSSFTTIPGGNCAPIPPVDVTCELSANSLTLDHHTVSSNSANNNTASGALNVKCSDNVKLEVSTPTPSITLADGLDSNLYVNDHGMDTSLNIDSAKNFTLIIESRLKKTGTILAGNYTGSYVLIISPY